ncbi:hypothetical protein BCR42DRAFT_417612 [Absidia repens]|uniref:MIT domain-containing protein n=1 Tax=Absidia repens TaxID=90262 RepID=A0A1X2IE09_9FUNG|nr:hypothetical protein BCR42DRAFT_417612 [Absidia repens]
MPRKTFFRTYGNKSAKSSLESTAKPEQCTIQTPPMTAWTEAALEKANMAVLYDYTGAPKQALEAYNEAITLLDKVFESTSDCVDQTRLKKIYDSYISRVSVLNQQLDNNELDPIPSVNIPIAQLSQESALLEPSAPTKSQRRPPSLNLTDSQTDHDISQPQSSKSYLKSPTPSHSIFSIPSPSKSTPNLSRNQSTMSRKKQCKDNQEKVGNLLRSDTDFVFFYPIAAKKIHRYSTELEPSGPESLPFSCKIEPPSLTLPDVEIANDGDYFDLQSTLETKHLLYSNPEPLLASMHDLRQKNVDKSKDETEKKCNGIGSHENAGNFYGNDSTTTTKGNMSTAMTRERSFSSSSSSNTATATKYQPQLTSSASSILTSNSSIYSPTASSFYSSTYINFDDDVVSPTSNKRHPPLPQTLRLPDINTDNNAPSFFDGSNDYDVGAFAKFLADSAATMPDRSCRTNGTVAPSIAAVIEEMEPELLSPPSPRTTTLPDFRDCQQRSYLELSRSPSSKSESSFKSRNSLRSRSSSSKRNKQCTNDDLPTILPTPTPSNTAKTISFWSKRNPSTKQNTIATLPPLRVDHNTDDSSSFMLLSPPIGSITQPSTPQSMTSSIDNTIASPRTSSSSSVSKRPIVHPLQLPSHSFGTQATQTALNKGIDVSITMKSSTMNKDNKQQKLMSRLLQSLEEGGYITNRLHAPKQLWCQKQVRLPAIDAKISTCEQLVTVLERMHAITRLLDQLDLPQQDITTEALYSIGRLEHLLDHIKQTFGKLQLHDQNPSAPLTPTTASTQHGKHHTHQHEPLPKSTTISSFKDPMTAWSGKLSKSVERMKIESKSSEEQIHAYKSTLIRLFTLASIFDGWHDIFTTLLEKVSMDKANIYDHLLQKTMMCKGAFHTVICGFVMQDLYILMDKWLKRNRDWLLD